MLIKLKHITFVILWSVCFVAGYSAYQFQSTPVSQFTGLWTGSSVIQYQSGSLLANIRLLVDRSDKEKAQLIVNFSPYESSEPTFQAHATSELSIIKRDEKVLTISLSQLHYSNQEMLEAYIQRQLPTGLVVSGKGWAIDQKQIFLYLTLSFGEKIGVVLNKVD
ncbi:hypothetical protein SO574_07630 [Vibrio alfacsensis]|uniref:hypothetical protein n=1 Tax=Vibrio alfacsensis TaxID=1074311 RepID=UPI002ADDBB5E|nr:hypothetical protein [Vibrio alfacsensis]WQE75099.1 hypothetical protein SO574_07630 [Vibrio alfacsensis]